MNKTRKLTEASLLTAIFIVVTIISVGSGIGYGFYLDYLVPVFYLLIYLRCGWKYSIISGISGVTIIMFVLGNAGTAVWASQGIMLGIMCGFLMDRDSSPLDDMMIGTMIAAVIMVFIDVYASQLIGFSFIKDFREASLKAVEFMSRNMGNMQNMSPEFMKYYADFMFYVCASLLPLGTVIVVYIIGLLGGHRLRMLSKNAKKKYIIIRNFKITSGLAFCSGKVFYLTLLYVVVFGGLKRFGIETGVVYIDVILNCFYYIGVYFMLREAISGIQSYLIIRGKKTFTVKAFTILYLVLILMMFQIAIPIAIMFFVYIDIAFKLRMKLTERLNAVIADKESELMQKYMKK